MAEKMPTWAERLNRFKLVLSVAIVAVPLVGTSTYWIFDRVIYLNKFLEQINGVNAPELANTLTWLELETLKLNDRNLQREYDEVTRVLMKTEDEDVKKILSRQAQDLSASMIANTKRQDELREDYKIRNKK